MKNVSVIDSNGFCISRTELTTDEGYLLTYYLKENERAVAKIKDVTLVKPKWDGEKWIEGATPSEIEEHNNMFIAQ